MLRGAGRAEELLRALPDERLRRHADVRAFRDGFKKAGKKLDMGKSCIRFKTVDDLPLEAIGLLVGSVSLESFVATYEASRKRRR